MKRYIGQGSERVPSTEASVPAELGCITLPIYGCVRQPGSSLNPILLGFCGGFFTWHDQLVTISSPPPLSGGWVVELKILTI